MRQLLAAGMNVARLNFSHGTHADHAQLIASLRAVSEKSRAPLALLADLQGPKIRLGSLPDEGVEIKDGEKIVFATDLTSFKEGLFPVTYKGLHHDVENGHRLLIDDGLVEVRITMVRDRRIHGVVEHGGRLFSHKGINLPDSNVSLSSLTPKDRKDLIFALRQGVDFIALSFVKDPADVRLLRRLIEEECPPKKRAPQIVVKIEKHEALDHFFEILDLTDAVMIARGDLGVEIPAEDVPIRQKELVEICRQEGTPVIVATQMLDSMIRNPRPTRAEVSDVANAVFDRVDAVMLSGETASGAFPIEAIQMMSRIVERAEASHIDTFSATLEPMLGLTDSIERSLRSLADVGHIDAIISVKRSDEPLRFIGRSRPNVPHFVAVATEGEARQMVLHWGIVPIVVPLLSAGKVVESMFRILRQRSLIKKGMRLAVLEGGEHGDGFDLISCS